MTGTWTEREGHGRHGTDSQKNRLLIVIIHKELLHKPLHFLFFFSTTSTHSLHLVKETENLAGNVLPPGLLVVHDSSRGGEDDVAELTRWQQLDDPLLEITELDVVAGGDDTGLVDPVMTLSAAATDRDG